MFRLYIEKFIPFTILPVAIITVSRFSKIPLGNIFIWWTLQFLIFLIFFWYARYGSLEPETKKVIRIVKLYLLLNVINIVRGGIVAENYWDWKGLITNTFGLVMPVVAIAAANRVTLQSILMVYIKYGLPLIVLIFPLVAIDIWGTYLIPLSFCILFLPVLRNYWKLIIILLPAAIIVSVLSARSLVLLYGVPFLLTLLYYFRDFPLLVKLIEMIRRFLLILPWVLFVLAATGGFNIFKLGEGSRGQYKADQTTSSGDVRQEDLAADTRTFLYEEALGSAIKHNYWILGRSPARGHDTVFFADRDMTGRGERRGDEVAILNVFTWTGLVGVILYFLVFMRASWLAINRSNNIYSKLIGLFVAFRWGFAWIGDINEFSLVYYVIWLMIGICFSESFRVMNDSEVKLWIRGVFHRKHYLAFRDYDRSI